MNQTTLFQRLCLVLSVFGLNACATSTPVMEWQDPAYSGAVDKILIIAAIERSTRRRVFEDSFVEALSSRGKEAIPSYTLLTTGIEISRGKVEAAIQGKNLDAVLVTRLLGVKENEEYHPPTYYDHHRGYHRYYTHALESSKSGSYRKFKILVLETNLYDTATQKLIWSMQSESIETSTPRHQIEEQINLTIDRLSERGLIAVKQ